jgi:hypothetical protein
MKRRERKTNRQIEAGLLQVVNIWTALQVFDELG